MLEGKEITFSYDGYDPVFESVSLHIDPGTLVILTGHTGSGKSTLAKILSGFIPHAIPGNLSGSLSVDGLNMSELSLPKIAQKVALVQQDPESQICTLRVSDEVAFGPENYGINSEEIEKRVQSSLEAVGSLHLSNRRTYALSGGEKQRVAIAAMLACQPDFLILDEPTSSLDPRGIKQLMRILTELRSSGMGILSIEHNFQHMISMADRVLKLDKSGISEYSTEQSTSISDHTSPLEALSASKPLITARSVSFAYNGQYAIDDIALDIFPGEAIALMGDNGSGKTTLLRILGGILYPKEGTIFLYGNKTHNLTPKNLAEKTGHVFQNPNHQIFERTVWREQTLTLEVLNALNEDNINQCKQLLEKLGFSKLEKRNPFTLSHGQKRRLNVSSAVSHNPSLCFLDEPFIGQDQDGRDFITDVILSIARNNGASVIVTHDSSFAIQFCTRIVFLENGRILVDGSPKSVLGQLREIGYQEYAELGGSI